MASHDPDCTAHMKTMNLAQSGNATQGSIIVHCAKNMTMIKKMIVHTWNMIVHDSA